MGDDHSMCEGDACPECSFLQNIVLSTANPLVEMMKKEIDHLRSENSFISAKLIDTLKKEDELKSLLDASFYETKVLKEKVKKIKNGFIYWNDGLVFNYRNELNVKIGKGSCFLCLEEDMPLMLTCKNNQRNGCCSICLFSRSFKKKKGLKCFNCDGDCYILDK